MKLKLSCSEGLLQCVDEFAAEDLAENCFGEKEVVAPGMNPIGVIRRQTAGGNDAVNWPQVSLSLYLSDDKQGCRESLWSG